MHLMLSLWPCSRGLTLTPLAKWHRFRPPGFCLTEESLRIPRTVAGGPGDQGIQTELLMVRLGLLLCLTTSYERRDSDYVCTAVLVSSLSLCLALFLFSFFKVSFFFNLLTWFSSFLFPMISPLSWAETHGWVYMLACTVSILVNIMHL